MSPLPTFCTTLTKTPSSQGTVNIKVGPDERNFIVHRDLLRHHSPYFDGALGGSFKESEGNLIRLPENKPDVFELFVGWLYAQRLDQQIDATELMTCRNLARHYVFADMRGVLRLKDAVITVLIQGLKIHPLPNRHSILQEIPYIYANTAEKSLLRKLLVDYVIYDDFTDSQLTTSKEYLTAEFLLEATLQMKKDTWDRLCYAS